jgi:mannose-6-phosphate isomerase class I
MKEKFGLDKSLSNYAWCFNCVPEENSLILNYGNIKFETPSINLVFFEPVDLLGEAVYGRFGTEFPIRFDYLDTMQGGNLSLQVHPLTEYIQENFGLNYTQDESYYMLDAGDDASVYLGLKDGIDSSAMINDLKNSEANGTVFNDEAYINKWPAKKHDHFLIPGGTIHCSGKNSVVLEISATPYISTSELWDWGRLGMDGKPRPININRGTANIKWDRTTNWVEKNLVNQIVEIESGDGWREERTGLHKREFIETRRHWFTKKVTHQTNDGVNVLTLIEGREIIVESPAGSFDPFIVHYAETFIIPAAIGEYTIKPFGESEGKECATIKAYVRVNG